MNLDELFYDQKEWVEKFLLEQNPEHMLTEEDQVMLMNIHRTLLGNDMKTISEKELDDLANIQYD